MCLRCIIIFISDDFIREMIVTYFVIANRQRELQITTRNGRTEQQRLGQQRHQLEICLGPSRTEKSQWYKACDCVSKKLLSDPSHFSRTSCLTEEQRRAVQPA